MEHKIRIDIGDFHLETEGSEDAIDKRVEAFKELVKIAMSAPGAVAAHQAKAKAAKPSATPSEQTAPITEDSVFAKLYSKDGKIVKLTHGTSRASDAFLLLLLGYRINAIEPVPVGHLLASLRHAGFSTKRIDTITVGIPKEPHELFNKLGARRAGTFKLTQPGIQKARVLAQEMVDKMV